MNLRAPVMVVLLLQILCAHAFSAQDFLVCEANNRKDFSGQIKIDLDANEFYLRQNSDEEDHWTLVYAKKTFCGYTPTDSSEQIFCPFQKVEVPGLYLQKDLRCDQTRADGTKELLTAGLFLYRKTLGVGHFNCLLNNQIRYDVVLTDCRALPKL